MCVRLVPIVLALCPFSYLAHAQSQNSNADLEHSPPCLAAAAQNPPSGPEVSISNVTFSGFIQMPISDQDEIVASVKGRTRGTTDDGLLEDALERIRAGWQDRGYFKVNVTGDARTATNTQIALFVHVDENAQYRLGGITFKNNRAIFSESLRDFFLIKDGDIFSREKIATGLENLRKAYGEFGYINYTGVPSTLFDDEKKVAYLEVNVDEGKQFYVSDINVEGVDGPALQRLKKELVLKPDRIYNSRLWELSLSRIASFMPDCKCTPSSEFQLDEQKGGIAITVDARRCSSK